MSYISQVDLSALSPDQLIAIIHNMAKVQQSKLTLKVSEKGALSLYGMGRWPVTLYRSQWERLLDEADTIRAFIKDHTAMLAEKAPAA